MKKVMMGVVAVLFGASLAMAAESMRHPGTALSTMKTEQAVNQDQLVKAVEQYIADVQKDKGSFMLKDSRTDQNLTLTQDRIGKSDVMVLGENKYYVPGVFKGSDGKTYDIDFIVKPTLIGKEMKVSDALIRRVDGVDRYQWRQDGNDWKRDDIKAP